MKDDDVRIDEVVASINTLSTLPNKAALHAMIDDVVTNFSAADKLRVSQSMHIGWRTSTKELRKYARACALVELALQPMMFQTGQQLINGYFTNNFTGASDTLKQTAARNKLNQLLTSLTPATASAGKYDYHRPVRAGTSISHADHQGPGTLGCFVRDNGTGQVMLLSNEHVMQYNGQSARRVLQPARFNGGCAALAIGTYRSGVLDARMDAAVAALDPATLWSNTLPDGTAIAGFSNNVAVGDVVKKYGCMSGMTNGTIAAINYASNVPHKVGTINFAGQYNITSVGAFQVPGDSGSVLLNANDEVIGLLHGGRADGGAMATPIAVILNHFGVAIA